ncbi:MAG: hypothetical protein Q8R07_03275, partial [Candidatus Uhrbacteria bacterium]|nr:hypothetical protein [Candidatus Uhrbacteria bacterium]
MPSQELTGAVASPDTVANVVAATAPKAKTVKSKLQTDGAYIPFSGPITNVRQLVRGKNVARGAIESFGTLADYTAHLKDLTLAELHCHAVEEARVTPIDDQDRLIRRLENNWTEVAARERGRQGESTVPK